MTSPLADSINSDSILGVILAGGEGRRMGGVDKPLLPLGDGTLLSYVLARAVPQCGAMIINANVAGNHGVSGYEATGLPIVSDTLDSAGPLAGVLAALDWAALNASQCSHVMSFAGDTPFIPHDLVARLASALEGNADIARGASFGQRHPVFSLWPVGIRSELRDALVNKEIRKIDLFTADYAVVQVSFDGIPDPFFNINTPEDMAEAERIIKV